LLQVDVDGVGPIAGSVEQNPVLHAVLLHLEPRRARKLGAWLNCSAIHELAVDRPLAIQAVKFESPGDPGRCTRARELIEPRIVGGVYAVIGDRAAADTEL